MKDYGLASVHAPSQGEKKKECNEGQREGKKKQKKKTTNFYFPAKWPRSGVTFQCTIK